MKNVLLTQSLRQYEDFYGIIIEKKWLKNQLLLKIFLPRLGFINCLSSTQSSQRQKIPPIFFQELNLIEGILQKPLKKGYYWKLENFDLKQNFIQNMPYANQWIVLSLLQFIGKSFYLSYQDEIYTIFLMTLKYMQLAQKTRYFEDIELLSIVFFLKSILISKIDSSFLYCGDCHQILFQAKSSPTGTILFSPEEFTFLCENCYHQRSHHQYFSPMSLFHRDTFYGSLFFPLESLISSSIEDIKNILSWMVPFTNQIGLKHFHQPWNIIVNKSKNPFLNL